eukprot:TRINITY_DN4058_c0_g1_i1.p1 TRINITY_DN4058_c0_g1~~TRINITY_DN4058_c0_g1_i1.p1  ORF type:complete len:548 (-),score=117.80 TRINITY_DN4058_c0_g1_i1:77-1720(-)
MVQVHLLDYGAGNVRSVINAIRSLGHDVVVITRPEDIMGAERLVFPGVGNFGSAIKRLHEQQYVEPLKQYLESNRPFLGICLGMQTLFESSEEFVGAPGLCVFPGKVVRFQSSPDHRIAVPHMGWNGVRYHKSGAFSADVIDGTKDKDLYFVHSYYAQIEEANKSYILTSTNYGPYSFISSVQKGRIVAMQFHPEKSGLVGLSLLDAFLRISPIDPLPISISFENPESKQTQFCKRIIACLDVRANDSGRLVVTKGDQYDVREKSGSGDVRNLGDPAEMAQRYFDEGSDEVTFLNITSFRNNPLEDSPTLDLLQRTSERVFVPLTIGGGIRGYTDSNGKNYSALDVASEYFRSGADKISIGSDAVLAAEDYYLRERQLTGETAIEQISSVYGNQAVVISVDPRRVYVADPSSVKHHTIETVRPGPNGEKYCWYQCTIKGGREGRDLGAYELVQACEAMGAGEILLNCMDMDGQNSGYDLELVSDVKSAVTIPVIASSGAGRPEHFTQVFKTADVEAALAAGIFHRREVSIAEVKENVQHNGIPVRRV